MNGVQAAIFSGSAMILLVLALRLLLKKHLPRGIFPVLWCAAAVRLLLPITISRHPRARKGGSLLSRRKNH